MSDKDYSISVIRLLAMIMIISCHILQGLNNKWAFWVNVGVQVFFFLSGFLYGKKMIDDYGEFYKKRIIKIMIPYVVLQIVVLMIDIFMLKNTYSIKKIIGCLLGFGAFIGNISILSHTWFISYILICYLLVPVLQMIFKENKYKTQFLLFLLVMFIVLLFDIYSVINTESSWINNFIIGYFYGKCCTRKKEKTIFTCFIIALSTIVLPLAIIYQERIPQRLPFILEPYSKIIVNYGHVLLGSLIFLCLYKLLSYIKIKDNIILKFSDKYSYYIYLVHQIFILHTFSVLRITKYLPINIVVILLLSIVSAYFLKIFSDCLIGNNIKANITDKSV